MLLSFVFFSFSLPETQFCVNRIEGNCEGISEINVPIEFEHLFINSTTVRLYVLNKPERLVYLSLCNLTKLTCLTVIGIYEQSVIHIDLNDIRPDSLSLNFINITVIFNYGLANIPDHITFSSFTAKNSHFYNIPQRVNVNHNAELDIVSISSFPLFLSQSLSLSIGTLINDFYNISIGAPNLITIPQFFITLTGMPIAKQNITLTETGFLVDLSPQKSLININFDYSFCTLFICGDSNEDSIVVVQNDSKEYSPWLLSSFVLSFTNYRNLTLFLHTDIIINSILNTSNLFIQSNKSYSFSYDVIDVKSDEVYISENVSFFFSNSGQRYPTHLFGPGRYILSNKIQIHDAIHLTFDNLIINDIAIYIFCNALVEFPSIRVLNKLDIKTKYIDLFPIPSEEFYSGGYTDYQNLTFFAISASHIHKHQFRIQYDSTQLESWLEESDNLFDVFEESNTVYLHLSQDPMNVYYNACVFSRDNSKCPELYDQFNISLNENPFKRNSLPYHYVYVYIPEILPNDHIFEFAFQSTAIKIYFVGDEDICPQVNISEKRTKDYQKITDIAFTNVVVYYCVDKGDVLQLAYSSITLNGVGYFTDSMPERLNCSEVEVFNAEFQLDYYYPFNVKSLHLFQVNIDEIQFTNESWLFIRNGESSIVYYDTTVYVTFLESDYLIRHEVKLTPTESFFNMDPKNYRPLIFEPIQNNIFSSYQRNRVILSISDQFAQSKIKNIVTISFASMYDYISIESANNIVPINLDGFEQSGLYRKMDTVEVFTNANSKLQASSFNNELMFRNNETSYFGALSVNKYSIPVCFPTTIVDNNNTIISSVTGIYKVIPTSQKIMFFTNNLTILHGKTSLLYCKVMEHIEMNPNTTIDFFHSEIGSNLSVTLNCDIDDDYPILAFQNKYSDLGVDLPAKYQLKIDDDETEFVPSLIEIKHKDGPISISKENANVPVPLFYFKTNDACQNASKKVVFNREILQFDKNLNLQFHVTCNESVLYLTRTLVDTSSHLSQKTIMIIAISVIGGVFLIGMIIFLVLYLSKRKVEKIHEYMAKSLLSPPINL